MSLVIEPSGDACGATVRGVDLSAPLDDDTVASIRRAWLEHHVLSFPDQSMTDDDLERFTTYFGGFGDDPFIRPIPGREHVIAVHRAADETAPVFAEAWHSDWSFQTIPPAGTCLYGIVIPPVGGDTLFVDQHAAYAAMPDDLRARIDGRTAIHSAGVAYGRGGTYGERDAGNERAMDIVYSDDADATHRHPLVCRHPESGKVGVFSCLGYIAAIEGLDPDESRELLLELYRWQGRPEFQYRHRWSAGTLAMWDNRSVLHMATGGYDGHERLLHRTTIAGSVPPTAA
jgi:taurine dioxygenase